MDSEPSTPGLSRSDRGGILHWCISVNVHTTHAHFHPECLFCSCSSSSQCDPLPGWVPDSLAPECMLCHRAFGLTRRRHHCRNCGLCICSKCSPRKISLPHLKVGVQQRVCNDCHAKVRDVAELRQRATTVLHRSVGPVGGSPQSSPARSRRAASVGEGSVVFTPLQASSNHTSIYITPPGQRPDSLPASAQQGLTEQNLQRHLLQMQLQQQQQRSPSPGALPPLPRSPTPTPQPAHGATHSQQATLHPPPVLLPSASTSSLSTGGALTAGAFHAAATSPAPLSASSTSASPSPAPSSDNLVPAGLTAAAASGSGQLQLLPLSIPEWSITRIA